MKPKREFWRGSGLANQIMHFTTDGTFVGQLGKPHSTAQLLNAPGTPLNLHTISGVISGSFVYLYVNDEAGRGVHRWKVTATP